MIAPIISVGSSGWMKVENRNIQPVALLASILISVERALAVLGFASVSSDSAAWRRWMSAHPFIALVLVLASLAIAGWLNRYQATAFWAWVRFKASLARRPAEEATRRVDRVRAWLDALVARAAKMKGDKDSADPIRLNQWRDHVSQVIEFGFVGGEDSKQALRWRRETGNCQAAEHAVLNCEGADNRATRAYPMDRELEMVRELRTGIEGSCVRLD